MTRISRDTIRNNLLKSMAPTDFMQLAGRLELVHLPVKTMLEAPLRAIEYIYFPEVGLVSIVAHANAHEQIEVGVVGHEGVTGTAVVLGSDQSPHSTFVQIQCVGWRIGADEFRLILNESPTLRSFLMRYALAHMSQIAFAALAFGRFSVEERLARWILMGHDRVVGNDVALTHEFLSLMLGVRRAGVTTALHILEGARMVQATRGHIKVLDRGLLIEAAGGSYGPAEAEYERLLGKQVRPE